jgi:hypothetical protein
MKVCEKHQNNKSGYGIEAVLENKMFLFQISSKLNVSQSILFFLFPKDNHKKTHYDIFKFK